MAWDGKRWTREGADARLGQAEHETARAIQREAAALKASGDLAGAERLSKWGHASESSGRLRAMGERVQNLLTARIEDFDKDPLKLNVLNGTLVFFKADDQDYVQLKPHDPKDLMTMLAPVTFDPEATCPRFDQFMDEVHPGQQDGDAVRRFLQQWGGLSLTGLTGDQKLTFHIGRGRNGKGVWVSTLARVMGDYAKTLRIESILDTGRPSQGGQASPDIARLRGVRFLATSEPGKGAVLAESFVKQLTGEDRLLARALHKEFFEFQSQAKLTMQGNYRPTISGTDEGIWGRVILVPWKVMIPVEKRDPNLQHKLAEEASGILNWLLDGLRDYLDSGLCIPPSVREATEGYRSDSDPLGRFLDFCTRSAPGARVQSTQLHHLYCAWARANGETEWSAKGLGAAMRDRGIQSRKANNVFWLDIELTREVSEFQDRASESHNDGSNVKGAAHGDN